MAIKDRDMKVAREPYKQHSFGKETLLYVRVLCVSPVPRMCRVCAHDSSATLHLSASICLFV